MIVTAGKTRHHLDKWCQITSDPVILDMVSGCEIEFTHTPVQTREPKPLRFNEAESGIISEQLDSFLEKGVIEPCGHEDGEFISNIFIRPKRDGSHRVILNLRELNSFVEYHHFKMETIQSCICLMEKDAYMASIDLKDAYYSIPVAEDHRKFLKFKWKGRLFRFTCLAMGLACAPRHFTKIMKVVFSHLRELGHISSGYLDDFFLLGRTRDICVRNVSDTVNLLTELGFIVSIKKSVTDPVQILSHIGFVLDSRDMTVTMMPDKHEKLKTIAWTLLDLEQPTIREVAKLVGTMVANIPAVEYGELYYRQLENEKALALKANCGDFEATMRLSQAAREDILWWINSAKASKRPISHGSPIGVLRTDASEAGWGAAFGADSTGGRWNQSEQLEHINCLELRAALFGIKALCGDLSDCHILLQMDNTTAVAYVREQGGTKSLACNRIAREIWQFAKGRHLWITPSHIPGSENVVADRESRVFNDQTEWQLDPGVFKELVNILGKPQVDMFASRLNAQCERYVTWRPDPAAIAVDAFTVDWSQELIYCFPPFSIIPRVLQKIRMDRAVALMIVPLWTTQPWFPVLMRMLIHVPILLPRRADLIQLPFDKQRRHPLQHKLRLTACLLSGKDSLIREFQAELRKSSWSHGQQGLKSNTRSTCRNGKTLLVDGIWIPSRHL